MEAALKNLSSTAELLAVAAQSDAVSQWDSRAVTRAFHWARYCQHLFARFHNNASVRTVMEKQLQLTNQSLRAAFPGYPGVSFSDLSQCEHLLLVGMLNNPELPWSIMKLLFDTTPVNTSNSEYQDVTGLCNQIIRCKSACKVLSPLTYLSAVGADAEVQGGLLMERMGSLLSRGPEGTEACRAERFLDSLLQGCEGAAEHFCMVIAAALLTPKNSAAETISQDFLVNWLQKKQCVLQHMCLALPTTLLMDLAKKHVKFRDIYCDLLKNGPLIWMSFSKLTEHFLAVFEACPSMRDDVEKELNALKISDGDFDVRGLSVWGDLLSALNK
ncbi:hypothetical protein Q5P01_012583 [Channa striata]|uniref:FA complementation group F n=1 Tax=Channa striata TaxID=64152 RepID=A0AA88MU17_CHASR|nr:hypothetical protein Q5P01_012583 [Channa striata]